MYKIKYISTGNIFTLPKIICEELKTKFPMEYQIIEKNGKKFKDKLPIKKEINNDDILSQVLAD